MSDLEPSEVELRRAARERALELLYEAEAKGADVEALLAGLPLSPAPLAVELVQGVEANRERIDDLLARRVAPRWSMARLAAVDRAILRLASYELLGQPDRSQAVILNEAVVLARRFGTEDSPRFVNGVLSAVAAEVRPQEPGVPEAAAGVLDEAGDPEASTTDPDALDDDAPGASNPPAGTDASAGVDASARTAEAGVSAGTGGAGASAGAAEAGAGVGTSAGTAGVGASAGAAGVGASAGTGGAEASAEAAGTAGAGVAGAVDRADVPGPARRAAAGAGGGGRANGAARRLVDGVVVDLDGVIRHWDESSLTKAEQDLGLPGGTIAAVAFAEPRFGQAMRGEVPAERWAREIGDAVAAAHPVDSDAVTDAFATVGWRIDESVVDLVRRVRRHVPVALLSNASSRLVDDLRLSGILDDFDAVVGSAELGVCKPDRRTFRTAAERLDVPIQRCLFVDDTAGHVAAARALGMRAIRFTDVDDLTAELDAAGLLDPVPTR